RRARRPARAAAARLPALLHHRVAGDGPRARHLRQQLGPPPCRVVGGSRTRRRGHGLRRSAPRPPRRGAAGDRAVRTVTLVSRDAAMTARLKRLLNGSLEVVALESVRDAVDPGRDNLADALLVDFVSTRI